MHLFGLPYKKPPQLRIDGEGLFLRPAKLSDFEAWRRLRAASRGFLSPWEPVWPHDDLTKSAFHRRVLRQDRERLEDQAYGFLIFRAGDHELLGGITLGNVRRGVAQCGTIGYWMGETHAGNGHMTRAVRALLRHAFHDMRLHRVEAACAPHNDRSRRLLERLGFEREGYARSYLLIDNVWQDHLLFAILDSDYPRGESAATKPGGPL
jgi:[ribosomal protein S5]-alanine N-acetyltransferase